MSSSYYDDFYSKFHNSQKIFTKNSNMQTKYFNEESEIKLTWENALLRVPRANGEIFSSTIKDLQGDEEFLKNKFKTIIYLHGCSGLWKGTALRLDFFAKNGYAVIAPASMARKKYPQSCDPDIKRGGLYRDILKIRQIDALNAVLNAKALSWTDNNNIFLVGLSEGAITTATYLPKNIASSVNGRIIEGWTCNAGWDEYRGINSPYNEPMMSLVAKFDPWFQIDVLKGDCGKYLNKNPLSKSIVVDDPILSKGHGLLHDQNIQKTTLEFLKSIEK
jgi:hypothetical protein